MTEASEGQRDAMRDICINQGYVPPKCELSGVIIYGLVRKGEDPCKGCNEDRARCEGRPKG